MSGKKIYYGFECAECNLSVINQFRYDFFDYKTDSVVGWEEYSQFIYLSEYSVEYKNSIINSHDWIETSRFQFIR